MAEYYVYSGAAGAANGTSWANAYTTFASAISGKAAGDVFYVADDHSESTAGAVSLTFPGSPTAPVRVYCVRRVGGSVPPVSADRRTTAVVATTGANSISLGGIAVIDGVTFSGGSGSSSTSGISVGTTAGSFLHFKNGKLKKGTTNNTTNPSFGSTTSPGSVVILENTTLELVSTGARWTVGSVNGSAVRLIIKNCASFVQGTAPTILFGLGSGSLELFGVDLSALTGTLISSTSAMRAQLINCKLASGVTIVSGQTDHANTQVSLINCDSADTNYRNERYTPEGVEATETTIVKTGGSTDGSTAYSRKLVSASIASLIAPLEATRVAYWVAGGAAKTFTIDIVNDGTTLKDDEIWLEAFYDGDASTPQGAFIADCPADLLTAGANQATSTATWTTTGLTSPVKQKLEVTLTPQDAGWVYLTVKLAKASTTVYVDPNPTVT